MRYGSHLTVKNLPIVGGNGFGIYKKTSSEETFNMMISDGCLIDFLGYKKIRNIGSGQGRNIYASVKFNHQIAVVGSGVFIIDTNETISQIGTLKTQKGNVFIAENVNNQIGIVDGLKVYIFDYKNNTFNVVDVDFKPDYICYQDSYFICADGLTNQFRLSDFNNGNIWPGEQVGQLQSKANLCKAVEPLNSQLYVFGNYVAESWYDSPTNQLFPYVRNSFYSIDYGCISSNTISSGFNLLCFLGYNEKSKPAIMYTDGGQPKEISSDGIDNRLSEMTHLSSAFGFLYKANNHIIYQLTSPQDNRTCAYDFTEKKFLSLTDENQNHHIAKKVSLFNDKLYFLSFNDGGLYEMNTKYTTYNGKQIPRIRICPPIALPSSDRFRIPFVNIMLEQGQSHAEQRVDLSVSLDGGVSYGNKFGQVLNKITQRQNQLNFYKLGSGNDFRLQFNFWSTGRFVIIGGQYGRTS